MKKTALLLAILVFLLTPLSAHAASPRLINIKPSISFSGTTATCRVVVLADSSDDEIQMTIKLWQGSKCIATWNEEGTGYVLFSDTVTVTKGESYELTVDATISGVKQPIVSCKGTCR